MPECYGTLRSGISRHQVLEHDSKPMDRIRTRRARNRSHGTRPRVFILSHCATICCSSTSLPQQVWSVAPPFSRSSFSNFSFSSSYLILVQSPGGFFISANMTSGTVSSLVLLLLSCTQVFAQNANTQQVSFNQVLNVNGDVSKLKSADSFLNTTLTDVDATQLFPISRPFKSRDVLPETTANNR